jgi:two-component system OmpR family response regulator
MKPHAHILIVEDDAEIARATARFLGEASYRTSIAGDGKAVDRHMREARPDLILLDLMLPGEDGLSICRRLRASYGGPIIMVTALGEEMDRVVGLELGADDYIAKPFSPREVLARVRAVLRRSSERRENRPIDSVAISFQGWRLDPLSRQVHAPDGTRVVLTGAEFDLLAAFCERPRRVLTRDQLLDLTQGRTSGPFDRSIDTLVSRIRQKIERDPKDPELIITVRLGGYMFTSEVTTS